MPSVQYLNNYVSKSANYSVSQIADQLLAASGALTFSLPASSTCFPGQNFTFINAITAGGTVTIGPSGTDTINGVNSSITLTGLYQQYVLSTDGAGAWFIGKVGATAGYINLPITSLREVASDLIVNIATSAGGHLAADTTPTLLRVNGVTDKALRLTWATNNIDEVQFPPVAYPSDLDDTLPVYVKLRAAKDANTNTLANFKVSYFEGVGDTDAGTSTASIGTTTLATYTVTIAASDIGAYPVIGNISLIPGAHANDVLYLYGAWIEYTRK